MATVVETATVPVEGERRFVIRDVGWEGYQALLKIIGDQPVRVTYDRGDAELMSPLLKHERNRSLLAFMVEILTEELKIPRMSAGSTTLRREDLDRGLEADEAYYLGDLTRIRDRDNLDLALDPPPDLAIEIEITRSVMNRLGIFGALGVGEIWRFNGERLRILDRQDDGSYREIPRSKVLPWVSIDELMRFLKDEETLDESQWSYNFREWVRRVVVTRFRGTGHDRASASEAES